MLQIYTAVPKAQTVIYGQPVPVNMLRDAQSGLMWQKYRLCTSQEP